MSSLRCPFHISKRIRSGRLLMLPTKWAAELAGLLSHPLVGENTQSVGSFILPAVRFHCHRRMYSRGPSRAWQGVKLMTAATKVGFALLFAAFMLVNPIGTCAERLKGAAPPAHPCCPPSPSPASYDCARSGCACIQAKSIIVAKPINHEHLTILLESVDRTTQPRLQPSPAGTLPMERMPFVTVHIFLSLHQFLI